MNTQRAKSIEQRENPTLCALHYALCTMRKNGFTYLALLAAIIILGISMGAAGKYWQNILQREKEEELLFRGDQYVKAIERYSRAIPGVFRTPSSIDNLLSDINGKRHLRRRYKDPITGEDFVEIFSTTAGQVRQLIGVHSSSGKEPLKQSNFPADPPYFKDFEGKKKYSEWQFVYSPPGGQTVIPGQFKPSLPK